MGRFRAEALWAVLLATLVSCGRPGEETSSRTRPGEPAARIVSLAPNITEILFALGVGNAVVGVTDYCNYPAAATEKTRVGGFLNPNIEAIARLEPTLLIGLPGHLRSSPGLGEISGAEFMAVKNTNLAEVLDSIRALGHRLGRPKAADSLLTVIETALRQARKRAERRKPRRVLFVTGRSPGEISDVYAPGRGSFYDELLDACGAVNVVRTREPLYPMLSTEEIVRADPEVIIELRPDAPQEAEAVEAWVREWQRLPGIQAVETGRIEVWTEDFLMIPGPRLVQLLSKLDALLERFSEEDR